MNVYLRILVCLVSLPFAVPAAAAEIFHDEGLIGAVTGGLAGGIIGHQSDHKTEGAILGSVAGYAIGTTIHRQKQRQRQLEREREALRQRDHRVERPGAEARTPRPKPAPRPQFTSSERQQLLLQAAPLFSVKRTD